MSSPDLHAVQARATLDLPIPMLREILEARERHDQANNPERWQQHQRVSVTGRVVNPRKLMSPVGPGFPSVPERRGSRAKLALDDYEWPVFLYDERKGPETNELLRLRGATVAVTGTVFTLPRHYPVLSVERLRVLEHGKPRGGKPEKVEDASAAGAVAGDAAKRATALDWRDGQKVRIAGRVMETRKLIAVAPEAAKPRDMGSAAKLAVKGVSDPVLIEYRDNRQLRSLRGADVYVEGFADMRSGCAPLVRVMSFVVAALNRHLRGKLDQADRSSSPGSPHAPKFDVNNDWRPCSAEASTSRRKAPKNPYLALDATAVERVLHHLHGQDVWRGPTAAKEADLEALRADLMVAWRAAEAEAVASP